MKKILLFIIFSALVLSFLISCSGKPYLFKESIDEIESIEIVDAENSLEYSVVKTLLEEEKNNFLKQFQKIRFHKYFGDPPNLQGKSIRVIYKNGDYDMVCSYTAEYVENGVRQFLWKRCDEKDFNDLLEKYMPEVSW